MWCRRDAVSVTETKPVVCCAVLVSACRAVVIADTVACGGDMVTDVCAGDVLTVMAVLLLTAIAVLICVG